MITLPLGSLIYVAGPYTPKQAKTNHDFCRFTQWNVDRAVDVGIKLMMKNYVVYIPQLSHYIQLRMKTDYGKKWYDFDIEILKRCDAILMMGGWTESKGAKSEYDYAMKNKIQVFFESDLK
jgi:hypothetical protein